MGTSFFLPDLLDLPELPHLLILIRIMSRNRSMAILVGGLDSAVLSATHARRGMTVYPVYIQEGFRWEPAERLGIRRFFKALSERLPIQPLTTLTLPMAPLFGTHWALPSSSPVPGPQTPDEAVYLPGRNVGLLTLGGLFCATHDLSLLAIGLLKNNPFRDSRPAFLKQVERTIKLGTGHAMKIVSPLSRHSKGDVIRQGQAWPLHLTVSCLNPKGSLHCGRCNKCAERKKGFFDAGVRDRTRYRP